MKKILVASFQRSGTHFLINNCATNFVGVQDGWVDVIRQKQNRWVKNVHARNLPEKIRDQLSCYFKDPTNKCVKTHYQAYFFERYFDELTDRYDILYMIRDPRDTLVACFNFYNNTNLEDFIKEGDFSRFLRRTLWEVRSETQRYSYSYVKARDIVDKWNKHVLSWLPYRGKGVTFVHFSALKLRHLETLKFVEKNTTQHLKDTIVEVTVNDTRYRPDYHNFESERGEIGRWKEYFSDEDLKYLGEHLSDDVKRIGYCDINTP